MKKLMYLFVAGTMFAFTACGGGETATEEAAPAAEEAVVEDAAEEIAEGFGCQIGEPCVEDHSCCAHHEGDAEEATEEATEEAAE